MDLVTQPRDGHYVVQTNVGMEATAVGDLRRRGFRTLFPRVRFKDTVARPLYSRYLFVEIDQSTPWFGEIWRAWGVRRLLGGTNPIPVSSSSITRISDRMDDDGVIDLGSPRDLLKFLPGHQVRILQGVFRDRVGICVWSSVGSLVVDLMVSSMVSHVRFAIDDVIHDPPIPPAATMDRAISAVVGAS